VYFSRYTIKGEWDALEATNGVLISDDGTKRMLGPVRVEGASLTGDGWTVAVATPIYGNAVYQACGEMPRQKPRLPLTSDSHSY